VDKPWWRRCLRPERLLLDLKDARFETSFNDLGVHSKFEITCREADGTQSYKFVSTFIIILLSNFV
jgi:hypothetical protein